MLGPWVVQSVSLPSCSSQLICPQMWDCPLHNLPPHRIHQPLSCPPQSSSHHLAMSSLHLAACLHVTTPPTGLDEYVFFNSLVVGLPYSSISCHFWLFFVFKLLLSFFWLCEEAQCVYLRLHPGRKSAMHVFMCLFAMHLFSLVKCSHFFPF